MVIKKSINGSEATITLEGWLDVQSAPQLEDTLKGLPEDVGSIVINMEKLKYISSTGIRLVMQAHKRVKGKLTLQNVGPEVKDTLSTTGLTRFLNIT